MHTVMSIESGASSIAIFDQIFNEKQIQTIKSQFFFIKYKNVLTI